MDFYLFQQINQFAGRWPFLDKIGIFFAEYSGYFLVALIFLFLFSGTKRRKLMAVEAFLAAILARGIITSAIRLAYSRPRPFVNHQVNLLLSHGAESSFPSGHAAFFFAISSIAYLFNKRLGILFLLVSLLMGVARIFVGIHYPLDILGGALTGIISAWITDKYLRRYIQRFLKQDSEISKTRMFLKK